MEKEIKLKHVLIFSAVVPALTLGAISLTGWHRGQQNAQTSKAVNTATNNHMQLTSSAFGENQTIPKVYTCDGQNISPPLQIADVPNKAETLALIMHDPDAPVAGGFTHWVVFNLDPATSFIPENSHPSSGTEAINSSGKIGYTGPCPPRVDARTSSRVEAGPPSGTHHYEFRFYALDKKLSLGASATKTDVEKAMEGHIIEQAVFTGMYARQ